VLYAQLKLKNSGRIRFSDIKNLKRLAVPASIHARHIQTLLRLGAIVFLLLAMARPQSGRRSSEVLTEGVDIVLTIDTSGSMQALDFDSNLRDDNDVNRLDVVKQDVRNFIKGRENDRVGMIVFGEQAFTQCPLTLDHGILLSFLDHIEIGTAGPNATAIGNALGVSVNRLKDVKSKSKIIILLTDGRNNSGNLSPIQAAELAKTYKIKIYTIGAGTKGEAPVKVRGFFGPTIQYQRDEIDESILQKIADTTGGRYFRAQDPKSLKDIYETIDRMEKTEVKVKEYMEFNELYAWFTLVGLGLLLLEIILGNTRFRKIP
jgi:Ca-activated chloride channel family protein